MKGIRYTPEDYDKLQARLGKLRESLAPANPAPVGRDHPLAGVRAPSKYKNRATGAYASVKEARRAEQLKMLQAAGKITGLREQVPFVLIPSQYVDGKLVERDCRYVCDFVFLENGVEVHEDTKGIETPDFKIKRKLMLFIHGIRLRIT